MLVTSVEVGDEPTRSIGEGRPPWSSSRGLEAEGRPGKESELSRDPSLLDLSRTGVLTAAVSFFLLRSIYDLVVGTMTSQKCLIGGWVGDSRTRSGE